MDSQRFLLEFTDLQSNELLDSDIASFYLAVSTANDDDAAKQLAWIQNFRLDNYMGVE